MARVRKFLASKNSYAIIVKYVLFAGISIFANLGTQLLISLIGKSELILYGALLGGTGLGLLVKYLLDKRYIFYYKTESVSHDTGLFILYSSMGVVTTAIFWGFELFFNYYCSFFGAKYLGGFIGLCIGYTTKYFLDKRWVFS